MLAKSFTHTHRYKGTTNRQYNRPRKFIEIGANTSKYKFRFIWQEHLKKELATKRRTFKEWNCLPKGLRDQADWTNFFAGIQKCRCKSSAIRPDASFSNQLLHYPIFTCMFNSYIRGDGSMPLANWLFTFRFRYPRYNLVWGETMALLPIAPSSTSQPSFFSQITQTKTNNRAIY